MKKEDFFKELGNIDRKYIDEAEEAVLLHQLPGLFEILFVHIYYLS